MDLWRIFNAITAIQGRSVLRTGLMEALRPSARAACLWRWHVPGKELDGGAEARWPMRRRLPGRPVECHGRSVASDAVRDGPVYGGVRWFVSAGQTLPLLERDVSRS